MSRLVEISPLKLRILEAIGYRDTATIVEIREDIAVEPRTPEAARFLVATVELLKAGLIDRTGDSKYVVTPTGGVYFSAFLSRECREHTA
jgi:hypothetical protein